MPAQCGVLPAIATGKCPHDATAGPRVNYRMAQTELLRRIEDLLARRGMSDRRASQLAGLGVDFIRDIRRRGHSPNAAKLARLAQVLEVTPNYLLDWNDEPDTSSNELAERAPISRDRHSDLPVPAGYVTVREYAADGAAGPGREPVLNWQGQAQVLAEWIIPKDFLPPEHRNATVAVVRVQGDSMSPSLHPHDRVMVDVSHDWLGPDGVYMAWNGLGVVFKRLQALPGNPPKVRFTSDNTAYEAYTLPADEVNIIGRVIGKWTWW